MTRKAHSVLVENAALVFTCDDKDNAYRDGAVVIRRGLIAWVGKRSDLPRAAKRLPKLDACGGLVTPGLVDAHTHPLFAGTREAEFALRAAGKTYLEIARAGGGILSTVRHTRAATDDELLGAASARIRRALASGTTTLEAKTGYDLTVEGELRLLGLYARLERKELVRLVPTLLGAHAPPPDYDRTRYVADCAGKMLEGARGLAHAVDVYCDEGAFTLAETAKILGAAQRKGFAVRAHAGQFADLGAAGLVAKLGGLSADHLENVAPKQAKEMAAAGTFATLLPGACVELRLAPPPVHMLRRAGCRFALGTDMNPGSSMTESLPLQMWLAMTHFGLTLTETWDAVTKNAARAAGSPMAGQLSRGYAGDLVIWDAEDPRMVPYHYGANLVRTVLIAGRVVHDKTLLPT